MKKLIFLLMISVISFSGIAQKPGQIVYLVTYDSAGIIIPKKCLKIDEVKKLFDTSIKGLELGEVYFDFYVELKKVNKRGKLRRIKK